MRFPWDFSNLITTENMLLRTAAKSGDLRFSCKWATDKEDGHSKACLIEQLIDAGILVQLRICAQIHLVEDSAAVS